jgi:predicted Rossmann-fold nucleotide-binding protein
VATQSIVVYCASSLGVNPVYNEVAVELGQKMAARNIRLIYGGGGYGLMGNVADAVLQQGAK